MKTSITLSGGVLAITVAALLTSSTASAALSEASVDCRATIAKEYGKLLKTTTKTVASCHKSRNKDVLLAGTDCNVFPGADLKSKVGKSETKFTEKVTAACAGLDQELTAANFGGVGKEYYISCPVACPDVTDNITTIDELAACLVCEAKNIAETTGAATLGLPNPADLDKDEQKCHGAIAKGYAKYLLTALKEETKCQGGQDSLGDNTLDFCTDIDLKGKVAKALTKAGEGIDKKCPSDATVADLDGCAVDTRANVKACAAAAWAADEDEAFTTTYEMEATGCPTTVRTTVLGRCSTLGDTPGTCTQSGFETGSVLDVGWKGLGHGFGVPDGYHFAVDVSCPGSEKGSCGTCTSAGISADHHQYSDFTRCREKTWIECSTPFSTDHACASCNGAAGPNLGATCDTNGDCDAGQSCTDGDCRYFLGPPLGVVASGSFTCSLNYLATDIVGTGDPDAGTSDFDLDLRAVVHLGDGVTTPCPYCRNDTAAQDGSKDGTCFLGERDGEACDVQGFDLSFAPQASGTCAGGSEDGNVCVHHTDCPGGICDLALTRGVSLDCPPAAVGANISGAGLIIQLPLTTGTVTKDAVDPCESPNGGLDCFCGVCSHAGGTIPCNDDAECDALSSGSTCGQGGGVARLPNNCTAQNCVAGVPTNVGTCAVDFDTYCDGFIGADGKGVIPCGVDADCDTFHTGSGVQDDWVCPADDCGQCTILAPRSCFLDPISLTGTPDPDNPILVGTFCLPPSSNGTVNSATGTPGPGDVQIDTLVELRYD